jgi:hypothetical protein
MGQFGMRLCSTIFRKSHVGGYPIIFESYGLTKPDSSHEWGT